MIEAHRDLRAEGAGDAAAQSLDGVLDPSSWAAALKVRMVPRTNGVVWE
jgi:hypothetical protein